ncbi:transcriptional regulator, partial [Streptomyces sp. B1866]|uniref:transcriptional regulator n=1 Tax=Streptomyces sp. B1866 TaxID=3075431 RepID=UPI0028903B44
SRSTAGVLACLLVGMVPGAATFRVTPCDPARTWPYPHARAYDTAGRPVPLNRAQALTVARWILRAHPEAARGEAYDFDLATARLHRAASTAAGRGR